MRYQPTLAILASIAVISHASSVTDVLGDIANISTSTTTLDNAINGFPATGGSLINALAIHTDSVSLGTLIDKGTTDVINVTPTPVSEANSQLILTAVEGFEPTILNALTAIVTKKPAFAALPIGGIPALVKQDLINLNASTFKFEAALIAAAPTDLKAQATAIKTAVDAAFATAIAAYS